MSVRAREWKKRQIHSAVRKWGICQTKWWNRLAISSIIVDINDYSINLSIN